MEPRQDEIPVRYSNVCFQVCCNIDMQWIMALDEDLLFAVCNVYCHGEFP